MEKTGCRECTKIVGHWAFCSRSNGRNCGTEGCGWQTVTIMDVPQYGFYHMFHCHYDKGFC